MNPTPKRQEKLKPLVKYLKAALPAANRECMVEIGSFCGHSAAVWAKVFRVVYCVDPWDYSLYEGDKSGDSLATRDQEYFSEAERTFDEVAKKHSNIVKIKKKSHDAEREWRQLALPQHQTLDFIYIDALHTYSGCRADIGCWLKHARTLIGGHDYARQWRGVTKAVDEVFGGPSRVFSDTSWVVNLPVDKQAQK